jgi:hypothetical protein
LEAVVSFEESSKLLEALRDVSWYGACLFDQAERVLIGDLCFDEQREVLLAVEGDEGSGGATVSFGEFVDESLFYACLCCRVGELLIGLYG